MQKIVKKVNCMCDVVIIVDNMIFCPFILIIPTHIHLDFSILFHAVLFKLQIDVTKFHPNFFNPNFLHKIVQLFHFINLTSYLLVFNDSISFHISILVLMD